MAQENLAQFDGKKVIVTRNLKEPNEKGELAVEIEGTAMAASAMGILLKPKGTTQADLIEASEIEEVRFAPEKPKKLQVRWLKDVEYGNARQHLVSSHGHNVSDIEPWDEAEALSYHNTLDHSDLGHQHGEKPKKDEAPKEG